MNKDTKKDEVTITGVKASTIAMFEGTLFAAIGLFVALLFALRASINLTQETSSVLAGMSFGLATGAIGMVVLPLVYFAIGWLLGYLHGAIFNTVMSWSGEGIVLYTKKK